MNEVDGRQGLQKEGYRKVRKARMWWEEVAGEGGGLRNLQNPAFSRACLKYLDIRRALEKAGF